MNPFLADVRRTADQAILDGLRPPPPVDYEKWAIDNVSFSDRESQFPADRDKQKPLARAALFVRDSQSKL
jgi:hypothetical protein